jgi:hypothetical protein
MIVLTLLAGIWTTTCIQTQISNVNSGYVKETYSIEQTGAYEFKREWFKDSSCTFPDGTDTEAGTVEMGNKISTFFMPGEVYEADFSSQDGVDLGAVSVKNNKLKVARGVKNSSFRNTMLSLFEYSKK